MDVFEVVGDDCVVEIGLGLELFEVLAGDGACVGLVASFEGELAFESALDVGFVSIILLELFFS